MSYSVVHGLGNNLELYHIEQGRQSCIGDFLKVTLAFPAAAAADLTQLSLGIDEHFYYNDLQTWRNLQTILNMLMDKSFDKSAANFTLAKYASRKISYDVSSALRGLPLQKKSPTSPSTQPCFFVLIIIIMTSYSNFFSQLIYSVAEEGEEEVWLHFQEERRGGRCGLAAVRACREGSPVLPQNPGHNHQTFIVEILFKTVKENYVEICSSLKESKV